MRQEWKKISIVKTKRRREEESERKKNEFGSELICTLILIVRLCGGCQRKLNECVFLSPSLFLSHQSGFGVKENIARTIRVCISIEIKSGT